MVKLFFLRPGICNDYSVWVCMDPTQDDLGLVAGLFASCLWMTQTSIRASQAATSCPVKLHQHLIIAKTSVRFFDAHNPAYSVGLDSPGYQHMFHMIVGWCSSIACSVDSRRRHLLHARAKKVNLAGKNQAALQPGQAGQLPNAPDNSDIRPGTWGLPRPCGRQAEQVPIPRLA